MLTESLSVIAAVTLGITFLLASFSKLRDLRGPTRDSKRSGQPQTWAMGRSRAGERRTAHVLVMALVLSLVACTSASNTDALRAPPSPSAPSAIAAERSRPKLSPQMTAVQARAADVILAFFDAYNAGNVSAAVNLVTDDILLSDCDWARRSMVTASSKEDVAVWLRGRIADHDRFVVTELDFGQPREIGPFAVAVGFERTSDTLRSLGFRSGIQPRVGIKVVVTKDGDRLMAFQAGSTEFCRDNPELK